MRIRCAQIKVQTIYTTYMLDRVEKADFPVFLTGVSLTFFLAGAGAASALAANKLNDRSGAAFLTGALAAILAEVFLLLIKLSKNDAFSSTTGSGSGFLMMLSRNETLSSVEVETEARC